jgi:signal transduction histidine kinase/CheY-like chemotaxis protein
MAGLLKLWQRIGSNGIKSGMLIYDKRYVFLLNIHLLITAGAYTVFLIIVLLLTNTNRPLLIASNIAMYSAFFTVWLGIKNGYIHFAKHLLLICVFAGIFFYDNFLGINSWVYFYYIPFLFVTINLCSTKTSFLALIFYIALPAFLFLITQITEYNIFASQKDALAGTGLFKYINFILSMILISIFAFYIITGNLANIASIDKSKINLQSLIDNTIDSIWSMDMDWKITAANKTFKEDLLKYFNTKVYAGLSMKEMIDSKKLPALFKEHHEQLYKNGVLHDEYSFGENYYEIFGSTFKDSKGDLAGATVYARNITERKKNEDALQLASINLTSLIDNTHAGIWSVDTDYKIIAANKNYKEFLRVLFNINIGPGFDMKPIIDLPSYPKDWLNHYDRVFNGESFSAEYKLLGGTYEIFVAPIFDSNKKIVGGAFYASDITKRKQSEIEIITAKDNAEKATKVKAQFLSNMSHELRTPLNGIIGLTNILMSEDTLPQQLPHLESLKYSGDHMLSLIDEVLDFNKLEADKMDLEQRTFNLKNLVERVAVSFNIMAQSKGISYTISIDEKIDKNVKGDPTKLKQILNNLLGNAFKFTEKGGVIFTTTAKTNDGDNNTCLIEFAITDTGIGIATEKIDAIFESFIQADTKITRKFGGTGLGLTISKKLATLMNGDIKVLSEKGKGSTFLLELVFECSDQSEVTKKTLSINQLQGLESVKALLVEDNKINLMVAQKILQKWGVQVTVAENGALAIAAFLKDEFDIILMDLEMPVMDGAAAVAAIRKTDTRIPIIAFTAASYENMYADLLNKGMNDYVQKPFIPADLHQKIERLLNLD